MRTQTGSDESSRGQMCAGQARGFTLIEVMVALAIVAIVAAIAIPSYSAYLVRGKRSAAKVVLLQAAQAMERAYTTGGVYPATFPSPVSASCAAWAPSDASSVSYCVTMTTAAPAPADGFLLTATPCGTAGTCPASSEANFVDAQCGALTLDNAGTKYLSPAPASQAAVDQCWQR